jgi:hypothetical protein
MSSVPEWFLGGSRMVIELQVPKSDEEIAIHLFFRQKAIKRVLCRKSETLHLFFVYAILFIRLQIARPLSIYLVDMAKI